MNTKELNPTQRFSDRVADYVKYRPTYPPELLDFLNARVPLKGARVADVGAGTGIFTKLLLEREAEVLAVEPNASMREAAVRELGRRARFLSGTAEATAIDDHSVDLITVAQAFHWFDPVKTRIEFLRILKLGAPVALIWNDADKANPLGQAYEKIKTDFGGEDYQKVLATEKGLDQAMAVLFGGVFESHYFSIVQELDLAGLIGRYFSSSYSPKAESPLRGPAEKAVTEAFNKFESQGMVSLSYRTEVFFGSLR